MVSLRQLSYLFHILTAFDGTLRLLVINTSSSSPVRNKLRRLPATTVINLSQSVAAECIELGSQNHSEHALKPDNDWESWFLPTPPAFDAPLGGLRRNINSVADSEKFWRCVYWFRQNPRTWQACLLLMHSTVWQKLTHLSHVCFTTLLVREANGSVL